MKSGEFKRWLNNQGAAFKPSKGIAPEGIAEWQAVDAADAQQGAWHGLVAAIKRQLGLK